MGTTVAGFPNLLTATGPNGPFANFPPAIETEVEWISEIIEYVNAKGLTTVEATAKAEDALTETCQELAKASIFTKGETWIFDVNIPGKPRTVYFYMGGLNAYKELLTEIREDGYRGVRL